MGDPARGLYGRFRVERTDGSSAPGEKHSGCEYFVLDLTHDPFAMAAIKAYATACRKDYPLLSRDLAGKLAEMESRVTGPSEEQVPQAGDHQGPEV